MAINRSVNYSIWQPPVVGSPDWNMVRSWWNQHGMPSPPSVVYVVLDTGMAIPENAPAESKPPREIMHLQWTRLELYDPKKLWQGQLLMGAAECMNDPDWALMAVMRYYGKPFAVGQVPNFVETQLPMPPNPPVPVASSPILANTGGKYYGALLSEPTPDGAMLTWEGVRYVKHKVPTPFGTAAWWERLD